MTQEILDHLNEILIELKKVSEEIDSTLSNPDASSDIADELDNEVYVPLLSLIDNFDDIISSLDKSADMDYFNDPYDDNEYEGT
jgi:hypothetical protein